MVSDLPEPLVPAEVDLRDFGFLPVDVRRLLTSDTWLSAVDDPRIGYAAMTLWCESWHQVPASSLPSNDKLLFRLSMCPSEREWKRVKQTVLAGFILCSDGRFYHPVVAEKALEAWAHRKTQSKRGKAGAEKRWAANAAKKAKAAAAEHTGSNGASNSGSNGASNASAMHTPMLAPMLAPMLSDSNRTLDIGEGSSEAKASGAAAPPDDPDKALWKLGVRILTESGVSESNARGILGKHYKADKVKLGQVLGEMLASKPIEPVAYLQRAMKPPERKAVI